MMKSEEMAKEKKPAALPGQGRLAALRKHFMEKEQDWTFQRKFKVGEQLGKAELLWFETTQAADVNVKVNLSILADTVKYGIWTSGVLGLLTMAYSAMPVQLGGSRSYIQQIFDQLAKHPFIGGICTAGAFALGFVLSKKSERLMKQAEAVAENTDFVKAVVKRARVGAYDEKD